MTAGLRAAGARLRGRLRPHAQASAFDVDFYCSAYPDVPRGEALEHYVRHGWREGRQPNAWFDPAVYLAAYPDVAAQDVDPLLHFVRNGESEGRTAGVSAGRPSLAPTAPASSVVASRLNASTDAALHELFDERYYRTANAEVLGSCTSAFGHFMSDGWREGRNPSATFDVRHYLEDNPDVASAGLNPFVHWVTAGRHEGRVLRQPVSPARQQLDDALTPERRALHWSAGADRSPDLAGDDLAERLARCTGSVVVSVSHDDYLSSTGGVQLLLSDEQAVLAEAGVHYLHVSPAAPLPMLTDETDAAVLRYRLSLDGERLGVVPAAVLEAALQQASRGGADLDLVVHQLMGHAPERIVALAAAAAAVEPVVWAHDYFALCSNYALMRNDVEFCAAPPPESVACDVCCYGGGRRTHLERMRAMFASLCPQVLAPSAAALETWQRGGFARAGVQLQPLARLLEPTAEDAAAVPTGRPLRVAHLGARTYLKGWHAFASLASACADDDRYEFVQLGLDVGSPLPGNVRRVPVRVHGGDPGAMVEALAAEAVDVVVQWSMAAETFSFTTYEAMAAGAYLVVRAGDGNVWPALEENAPQQGHRASSEEDLLTTFADGSILERVAQADRRYRLLLPSGAAADVLLKRRIHRLQAAHSTGSSVS